MIDFFQGPQGGALKILAERLWAQGHQVFLAGGCVRDALLGRPYKDIDVVTDASVEQVQGLFEKTIPVGVQFGIIRVLIEGFEFEVARFRSDGAYMDGRHPVSVRFAGPEDDAARRDFTVNALFYDLRQKKILDYVGGQSDLKNKILRAVGEPHTRFAEDYLRILRLLRFSCQLDFAMEAQTALAAQDSIATVAHVSGERLRVEIAKTIEANGQRAFEGFLRWNLCEVLFPQWNLSSVKGKTRAEFLLSGHAEIGWLLSSWLLNFQKEVCESCMQIQSESDWKFNKMYLERVQEIATRFCLSRRDAQILREVGAVLSWPSVWFQLRLGSRAVIAQSPDFAWVVEAAQQLKVWPKEQWDEVVSWRQKPPSAPFLTGHDVEPLKPERRGLVLREGLYLQYEGAHSNREEALRWLREQFKV